MFEIGKDALCIKVHPHGYYEKMKQYPVDAIRKGCKHAPVLLDIGLPLPEGAAGVKCGECGFEALGITWVDANDFQPLDNSLSEITLEDILKQETVV